MMADGVFSMAVYYDMRRKLDNLCSPPHDNPLGPPMSFAGVSIRSNAAFPMTLTCPECGGNGEGKTSTYCRKCKGQGSNRYEGMMQNGPQTVLLTVPLPKAFAPSFPTGLIPAPKLCRGLT